jgi:hypothetical protein
VSKANKLLSKEKKANLRREPTTAFQRAVRRLLKFGEKEIRNVSQRIHLMGNKCLVVFKQIVYFFPQHPISPQSECI